MTIPEGYGESAQGMLAAMGSHSGPHTEAQDVVEAIWRVVHDPSQPVRQPAGAAAVALAGP